MIIRTFTLPLVKNLTGYNQKLIKQFMIKNILAITFFSVNDKPSSKYISLFRFVSVSERMFMQT